jgi:hypothetical protein
VFSQECGDCHSTSRWSPANLEGSFFQHEDQAGFSLALHGQDYNGQALTCASCHTQDLHSIDLQKCLNCHSEGAERAAWLDGHQNLFGPTCLDCHDGIDRYSRFDHAVSFPLEGRHAAIECQACHQDRVFQGISRECSGCHSEPEIHAGFFGLQCQYCHTAKAWTPAELRAHTFPVDHGTQAPSDCKLCHIGRYDEITCYGCHDHQPEAITVGHLKAGIAAEEIPNCTACHESGLVDTAGLQPGGSSDLVLP